MSENIEAPDQFIEQLVDTDPSETAEWEASFDAAVGLFYSGRSAGEGSFDAAVGLF